MVDSEDTAGKPDSESGRWICESDVVNLLGERVTGGDRWSAWRLWWDAGRNGTLTIYARQWPMSETLSPIPVDAFGRDPPPLSGDQPSPWSDSLRAGGPVAWTYRWAKWGDLVAVWPALAIPPPPRQPPALIISLTKLWNALRRIHPGSAQKPAAQEAHPDELARYNALPPYDQAVFRVLRKGEIPGKNSVPWKKFRRLVEAECNSNPPKVHDRTLPRIVKRLKDRFPKSLK
jgi:hypothetical protein